MVLLLRLFVVEKFGTERIKALTKEDIDARIGEFVKMMTVDF